MGQKDTVTKDYIRNAEVFADAFNYLLYEGEKIIMPESLHELDPAATAVVYGDDLKAEPVQRYRDKPEVYDSHGKRRCSVHDSRDRKPVTRALCDACEKYAVRCHGVRKPGKKNFCEIQKREEHRKYEIGKK